MKLGIVITQTDPETVFNALRLASYSLKQGDQVRIFLSGRGVEIDKISDAKFDVKKLARELKDGQVLLLGIDHTSNTTVHLCEYMSGVRYRRKKHLTLLQDGRPVRFNYAEIDHCCQNFVIVDDWLDTLGSQRMGWVGYAQARLIRSRDIVAVVTEKLRQNETVFLHPFGVDEECDEARASLNLQSPK